MSERESGSSLSHQNMVTGFEVSIALMNKFYNNPFVVPEVLSQPWRYFLRLCCITGNDRSDFGKEEEYGY